jgi:hypothetical protein
MRFVLFAVFMSSLFGCRKPTENSATSSPSPLTQSPSTPIAEVKTSPPVYVKPPGSWWHDYDQNLAKAELTYNGNHYELTLRPDMIDKTPEGKYFVGMSIIGSAKYFPNVVCVLTTDAAKKLATVQGMPKLVIRGKCEGRVLNPASWKGFYVRFVECDFEVAPEE